MKEKSRMAGGRYIQNQQLEEIRLKEDNLDRTMKIMERHSINSQMFHSNLSSTSKNFRGDCQNVQPI